MATGHSLQEEPYLFAKLEYIRTLRNSITHDWKPIFKINNDMENKSRYLHIHKPMDGHLVSSREEVSQLINEAIEIIHHTEDLFNQTFC